MKIKHQHQQIELQWVSKMPLVMLIMVAIGSSGQTERVMAIESQPKQIQTALPSKTATEPKSARDYFTRGMLRYRQQDRQNALADLDRAIKLQPNFVDAYNNRGIIKGAMGDTTGAIADYTRAIAIEPKYFEAYANRGFARLSSGDKTGAAADLQIANQLKPNDPQLALSRGVMLAQAEISLERSLAITKQSNSVRKVLKLITIVA